MLKKRVFLSAVLALCLAATASFAETQKFTKFSLDIPAGWTATQNGDTVIVLANDNSASISITRSASGGMDVKDLASAISQSLQGSEPQKAGPGYAFTFKAGAVESKAVISGNDKEYVLIVGTGDHPQIDAIINSLEDL